MEKVIVKKVNEVYNKIFAEPSIIMEMSEYFTFDVPGAKFTPAYKNRLWDGKIRLLNSMTCLLYAGLNRYIEEFCKSRDYVVEYENHEPKIEITTKEVEEFISTIKLPKELIPRDYQLEAVAEAIRTSRGLFISPTSSGKSLIIYLLMRYYARRTLIIVPTTSLVNQLASDFADYGFESNKFVHRIYSGNDKQTNLPIVISTWQSIYKMDKEYFRQFDLIIGDEAHLFKAKSLISIMTKLEDCKYRFGFTGTLDGTQTNKLVLEGLFGPLKKVITTSELIEKKYISSIDIKSIVLSYPDDIRKIISKLEYQKEMDFLVTLNARNVFIKNLALSLEGNTLLLFQYVEKHGKLLHDMLKEQGKIVHYVHGKIDVEVREKIRKIVETEKNSIIIASYGTFSTGINIKNLHNIVFTSPFKSIVRNLQSIGRVLRRSNEKTHACLYDIADDCSWKNKRNHTLNHFMERIKIYNQEKFPYKIYNVNLNM